MTSVQRPCWEIFFFFHPTSKNPERLHWVAITCSNSARGLGVVVETLSLVLNKCFPTGLPVDRECPHKTFLRYFKEARDKTGLVLRGKGIG